MSLNADGRQAELGKTEYSTTKNSKGWMLRWEMIERMSECVGFSVPLDT